MNLKYSAEQRTEYLDMTGRVGQRWLEIFQGDTQFYSAVYWDLLTGLWRRGRPVPKTEAMGLMTAVRSAHTAGKHVDTAIDRGMLSETGNPRDARSKLVGLTPEMRRRLDVFFDTAAGEMCASADIVSTKEMAA